MGLLDDAIREHLDLKRRRGADPTEVERAEREALGPVRRTPERGLDEDPELAESGLEADIDEVPGAAFGDEPAYADEFPPAAAQPALGADPEAEDSWSYENAEAEREGHAGRDPSTGLEGLHGSGDHTVEYDVEEALGAGREPERPRDGDGEDVLEETPEFLQDTPDHDRLWFEQRPPRDFDFDK